MSANQNELPNAGVLRRFGAIIYDTLPVLALLIIGTFPFVPFLHGKVLVPKEVGALAYLYWLEQVVITVLFFGFFWTRRGQTIGMLAWRLRVQSPDGSLPRWSQALVRLGIIFVLLLPFVAGYWLIWGHWPEARARQIAMGLSLLPLLVAYLWIWVDREHLALHDRWSGTRMVVIPKRGK
ncbi:MAG TPA: RDD family protein [Steroidobacteraceae bacterium]